MALTNLTFTQDNSAKHFVYSNSPEALSELNIAKFTVEKTLTANIPCEFEYYHKNNGSSGTMRMVIAIKNTSSSTAQIIIPAAVTDTSAGTSASPTTYKAAAMYRNFFNGYGSQQFNINPSVVDTRLYFDVPHLYLGIGKFMIQTNVSGVRVRIAYCNSTNFATTDFFSLSRINGANATYCGEVGYSRLRTSMSLSAGTSFKLCEHWYSPPTWPDNRYKNVLEYKVGTNYSQDSKCFNAGNYGLAYELSLTNCTNRKLVISPPYELDKLDQPKTPSPISNILVFYNGNWQEIQFGSSSGTPATNKTINLSTATQTVVVYHPAGNNSNYIFTVQ